jgi:hypothetical protein
MSTEPNRALIRRFHEEVWGKGNVDVADEISVADYVRHDLKHLCFLHDNIADRG